MTPQLSPAELFDDLRADLVHLANLSERQRAEVETLDRSLRAGIASAMGDARTVKDSAADARRQLDVLVGRIDRLTARAQVTIETDGSAKPSAAVRLADFGPAIEAAQRDVASTETAWQWVERTTTTVARQAAAAVPASGASSPAALDKPVPQSGRPSLAIVAIVVVAVLVLAAAVAVIVI